MYSLLSWAHQATSPPGTPEHDLDIAHAEVNDVSSDSQDEFRPVTETSNDSGDGESEIDSEDLENEPTKARKGKSKPRRTDVTAVRQTVPTTALASNHNKASDAQKRYTLYLPILCSLC